MNSDKSLGPNSLNPSFYKRFWHLCGLELFHFATCQLENGFFPSLVNKTSIVLIPKNKNPKNMKDFIFISLCNVLYKIISKTLANPLKPFLPSICVANQLFFENRSISNNVLIASEIIHHMRCKIREISLIIGIKSSTLLS